MPLCISQKLHMIKCWWFCSRIFKFCHRCCKKSCIIAHLLSLIPFTKPLRVPTASHKYHPDPRANKVDKQQQSVFVLFLFNPQSISYVLLFFGLAMLTVLTITDVLLKIVFVICSCGVYCATYHCRLQSNQPGSPQNIR